MNDEARDCLRLRGTVGDASIGERALRPNKPSAASFASLNIDKDDS